MTLAFVCDRCGRPMDSGEQRFIARIEVYAAADPLHISEAELAGSASNALERLIEQCRDKTEEELMRDVHVAFRYDLCRRCQLAFLANPLAVS